MLQFTSLQEVKNTARDLMNQYDLYDWTFKFSNTAKTLGCCVINTTRNIKRIELSQKFFGINLDNGNVIVETILHEIAHALDFKRNCNIGHGATWKAICREIGCSDERTADVSGLNKPTLKYSLTCSNCGRVTQMARRPKYTKACGKCCREFNNGKYTSKYAMELVEN